MAIRYEITRLHYLTQERAPYYRAFARADAAKAALQDQVYAMLQSAALLDRPIAARLMADAAACEVSPPPIGYERAQTFKLGEGNDARVTFTARRIG